jgi:hypothetical protein
LDWLQALDRPLCDVETHGQPAFLIRPLSEPE